MSSSDLGTAIQLLYLAFKALNRDKSKKFQEQWDKDLPELVKAVRDGDIETIKKITAKYYEL